MTVWMAFGSVQLAFIVTFRYSVLVGRQASASYTTSEVCLLVVCLPLNVVTVYQLAFVME